MLKVSEAAAQLGMTDAQVRSWISSRRIKAVREGHRLSIAPEELVRARVLQREEAEESEKWRRKWEKQERWLRDNIDPALEKIREAAKLISQLNDRAEESDAERNSAQEEYMILLPWQLRRYIKHIRKRVYNSRLEGPE